MAQSKSTSTSTKKKTSGKTAKTDTKAKKTDSRKKSAPAPRPEPAPVAPAQPIRREVGGVFFLCLGIFVIISYFNTEGSFIAFSSDLLKGLIGWGYWLTAPMFLFAALILFFHRGKPVEHRVSSTLMLPILFAAILHLMMAEPLNGDYDFRLTVGVLFVSGQQLVSGGVLGGLIAIYLNKALSVYGAFPLLIALMVFFLILALRGGFTGMLSNIKPPEFQPYDPEAYKDQRSPFEEMLQSAKTARAAETRSAPKVERLSREATIVDIPLGEDEDEETLSLRGPSRTTRTESTPKKTTVRRKAEERPTPRMETFQIPMDEDPVQKDAEDSYLAKIEWLTSMNKTVVIASQVMLEGSDADVYEVGYRSIHNYHALQSYDMTIEAAITKLMWILAQTGDAEKIRRLFLTPVSHDISHWVDMS